MPASMERKQPSLCTAGCPPLSGSGATGAARAAHKRSLEKFAQFCRTAVTLRRQAELGAHRTEWVRYAAELHMVERSLQLDLHNINLLISRIQSRTQLGINVDPVPRDRQQAATVGAPPEREKIVVKESNAETLGNGTNEMKKEFWCPTLWSCRDPAGLPTALTRAYSCGNTSPTTSGPLRHTEFPHSEECTEPEDKSADMTASSTACTPNTSKHPGPVLHEEAPNGGLSLLRKAQTLTNVLRRQVSGVEGAQMKNILELKRCANVLAQYSSTYLTAGRKQSMVNTDTRKADSPEPFEKIFSAICRYRRHVSREKSNRSAASRHQLFACDVHDQCVADRDSVAPSCKDDSPIFCTKTPSQSMKPKHDGTRLVQCGRSISRYTRIKKLQSLRCIPALHSSQKAISARNVCSSSLSCFVSSLRPSSAATTEHIVQFLEHSGVHHLLPPKDPGGECELQGAAQQVEDLQDNRHPKKPRNVSEQAGTPTKQNSDQHDVVAEQGCQAMQTQYESVLSHRKFMEHENLPVNYQVSCRRTHQIFHHIAEIAYLLQMQHGILDHMDQQLQLEEASAEQEVRRTRVHLHHLIRGRAVFPASLVGSHRSRTNAGKRLHKSDECAGDSASLSRFSTESESQLQCQNQTLPERGTHSSGEFTDEEEELLQELAEAEDQYPSVSSSVEGQRSVPGDCNAIVKLRRRYVSELEKLEVDLEKQLNVHNQQADDLNIQLQSLLHKACGGRGSKPLQDQEKVLDQLSSRGALCGSQGSCDLRQDRSTFPYVCCKESGTAVHLEFANTCPAELMETINLKRVDQEEDYKPRTCLASHTTRNSPSPCMAPPCRRDVPAIQGPTAVVDAASMSSDCTASAAVLKEVEGNQEVERKCKTTFPRSSSVDRNSAIALLRYATTEFQHSNTGRLQQTGCTLRGKLKLIFPEASAETLRKLLYVDKKLLLLQQRRAATLWCFARRREKALTATREQLSQLTLHLEEAGRRKERDVRLRKRMAILQKRLEAQRRQAQEQRIASRTAAEASAAAENARKVKRMKREQQRRAEDKRLLAELSEARAAACKQQELEAAAAAEREAVERAARARRNRHIWLRRREEDLWKSRTQAQARQYEALRQTQVIEHLLKLAEKCAVYVPPDPYRVQQPTCASQARTEQIRADRQEAQELQGSGHRLAQGRSFACFEVPHGYTVEKLLSDTRLRLSTALHEAGLSQTRAGREALLGLHAQATAVSDVAI